MPHSVLVPPGDAQVVITGDDTVNVWLNGTPLAASPRAVDAWKQALYVDLGPAVRTGANTLAVAARNTSVGPAATIARLQVVSSGGTTSLVTDGSWKSAQTVGAGWEQPEFNDTGWPAAANLGVYGTGPWASSVLGPDIAAVSPLSVAVATTEHQSSPLGVDAARPRFGWQLNSSATQLTQAAYQVIVASSAANANANNGDVWDSGRAASQSGVDIAYAGPALAASTRYYWRVRVWDGQGRASGWSSIQSAPHLE